jgi:hypothetical protein
VKKLLLLFLLLSASSVQQKTIAFVEPIDAVSVTFASKTDTAMLLIGDNWLPLAVEDEQDPTLLESNLVILPESNTQIVLRGNLHRLQINPITVSAEPVSYEVAALNPLGRPRILKRHQWGADDSFLFSAPTSTTSGTSSTSSAASNSSAVSKRAEDCNTAKTNYPGDFQVARTVTHDGNGQKLRWARRYSPDVQIIAVHHTAQKITGDLRSPVERMRALYAFHANSRGWGDIGYHYLIDEEGTIYEGRSGGENVVGGHVYCGNVGTLGVALMGNFDEEQPTQVQVHALQWLLKDLASTYDIPLNRNTYFHGKNMKTIVRHKDLISTECPGHYMSAAISQVRNNVIAGRIDNNVTFPTIAKATRTDSRETRLSARLEQAGEAMSRRFFRAKRLVRTADRKNPNDARLQMIERGRNSGTNIQRQRAATEARRRRIADARLKTARPSTATPSSSAVRSSDPNDIRIRLSTTGNNAEISANGTATINGKSVTSVRLGREGDNCVAVSNGSTVGDGIVRIDAGANVLRVDSWNTLWNRFRGVIECRIVDGELVLINELPLEDYMAGLSEQPDTEHFEKQRAFTVAARSYAAYYMQDGHTKFAGMPYHGSDTGASFQNYSGVTSEQRNPNWVRAVIDTADLVLTKDNQIVKAAYFSSDDGRTRSPKENGWNNFPFAEVFASKPDPWCKGMRLHGHGVGMSGCGAKAQAAEGKTAEQILRYYYPGTILLNVSAL